MAFYTSVLASMKKQIQNLQEELQAVHKQLGQVPETTAPPAQPPSSSKADVMELETKLIGMIEQVRNEFRESVKTERLAADGTMYTRLENQVTKTIKDRIELASQNLKAQIMADVQLLIEELKEDVMLHHQPSNAVMVEEPTPTTPPTLPASIDIEALTKDLMTAGPDSTGESEFTFHAKRKVLKKTK